MIEFFSEGEFQLQNSEATNTWLSHLISLENCTLGELSFIFCNDDFLHNINLEFLNHDTLTDIISFDYSLGKELHGEIYISVERVIENAKERGIDFIDELDRVMAHGVLHLCGYGDKTVAETNVMRAKEDKALRLRKA